jgi:hypothetical protein
LRWFKAIDDKGIDEINVYFIDLIDLMFKRLNIFNIKEGWFFKMEEREEEYI